MNKQIETQRRVKIPTSNSLTATARIVQHNPGASVEAMQARIMMASPSQ